MDFAPYRREWRYHARTTVDRAFRERMLARGEGGGRYRFDVLLRGARESVFFDD